MRWRQDNECRDIMGDLFTDVPLPGAQHGAQDTADKGDTAESGNEDRVNLKVGTRRTNV